MYKSRQPQEAPKCPQIVWSLDLALILEKYFLIAIAVVD